MVKEVGNIIIKVLIVAIMFQAIFMPISNASTWGDIFDTGDEFIEGGKNAASNENAVGGVNQNRLDSMINEIYNLLLTLGVALSVIIGAMLGIKFMIGSVEEQAKIKEMLLPYATGCIVVFGAFGLWKLLMVLLSTI